LIERYVKGHKDSLMGIVAICYGLFTNEIAQKDYHKYDSDEYNKIKRLFRF